MTSRYVMAQIYMPIEIKPDNTVVSLHEYADIRIQSVISNIDQLSRPSPIPSLMEQIEAIFAKSSVVIDKPVPLVVQRADIKPRTRAEYHNSSFKRKGSYTHRKTNKLRPPILRNAGAGSSLSPTVLAAELVNDRSQID